MGLHVVHVESESKPDMCFTSLVLLRARLPSALATEIVTAAWKGGLAPLPSPPYESHLRRRPRPLPRRRLARYYSGHVLFSFIFYGAEYGDGERETDEGDSGDSRGKEGGQYGKVTLSCCTALQHRCPLDSAPRLDKNSSFHSVSHKIS